MTTKRRAAALSFDGATAPVAQPPATEPAGAPAPAAPAAPVAAPAPRTEPADPGADILEREAEARAARMTGAPPETVQGAPYHPHVDPRVPAVSEPASGLASLLADTDTRRGAPATGLNLPLEAFMAGPVVDPDLDRINPGARLPRYLLDAARTQASLTSRGGHRVTMQDLLAAGLRAVLAPELVHAAYIRHGGQPDEAPGAQR